MSEPKLISPLLDGFSIGSAISDHDGVRSYPALKENSEKKYIVKIISIPASQVQLDALLLTGAYREPSAATAYFQELAENVEKEAAALKNLSRVEGFLAFEGWQVVPMEGRLGYEVYLLACYHHSLDSYVRRNSMTHLAAVNLGIDICSALSSARRAGWIYADLKPANIYISEHKEYRIGDLGLMELDGLDLADLPGKYHSAYTPPELADHMLSPNTTMDTYALGLILYQIFNNGQLPQVSHPMEDIPPFPVNADYEMAEIIIKACHPNPAQRWEDPVQMGQALVAYLQRNTVNDIPIIPPVAQIDDNTEPADLSHPNRDETLPGMNDDQPLDTGHLSQEMTEMISQADELIFHEPPAPPVSPENLSLEQLEADIQTAVAEELPIQDEESQQEESETQLWDVFEDEEESTEEDTAEVENHAKPVKSRKKAKKAKKDQTNLDNQRQKARFKRFLGTAALVTLIVCLLAGSYLFYTGYYVQMVNSLSVSGSEDEMTVQLDTTIRDDLLTVICTDAYGNTKHQPVVNGAASFTDLLPDMLYKIRVEIEGFHRLDGSTTHEYMTPAETKITSFTAATGPEDGTAILNFTVDGPDSEEWTAVCTTEGEDPIRASFTGHLVTVNGLTVGKTYTISLEPTTELYIPGINNLEFTAASIVVAEDLKIVTSSQDSITVTWNAPDGASVSGWSIRCYNTEGYDQTITTDQLTVTFDGITFGTAYTVEVIAAGMTQPARASITANPLTVTGIQVDDSNQKQLTVSWTFEGEAPEGGWLLLYTIDGNGQTQIVQCAESTGIIAVRIPNATYDLTIQSADGTTVFDGTHSYTAPAAKVYRNDEQMIFERYQSELLFTNLLKTPVKENWNFRDVTKADFTTAFRVGDKISVHLYYLVDFYVYHEDISVMYVIRDAEGKVISDLISMENKDWNGELWDVRNNYHYCYLNIPRIPAEAGSYTLDLYFDGMAFTSIDFTIAE